MLDRARRRLSLDSPNCPLRCQPFAGVMRIVPVVKADTRMAVGKRRGTRSHRAVARCGQKVNERSGATQWQKQPGANAPSAETAERET